MIWIQYKGNCHIFSRCNTLFMNYYALNKNDKFPSSSLIDFLSTFILFQKLRKYDTHETYFFFPVKKHKLSTPLQKVLLQLTNFGVELLPKYKMA